MDFREATNELFDRVDHAELAEELHVSVATVRQARLQASAKAHREPPTSWQDAVIRLAEERIWHYRNLINELRQVSPEKMAESRGRTQKTLHHNT
jgi:hypothetical protein